MPLTPEKFDRISSGVKNWATVVALMIAGVWAMWTFNLQRNDAKAKEIPALDVHISASQEGDTGHFIRGRVDIKNVGTQYTTISLDDGPLVVARIKSWGKKDTDGTSHLEFDQEKTFNLARPPAHYREDTLQLAGIRPGATEHLDFLVEVQNAGQYSVMFSAKMSQAELDRLERDDALSKEEMERLNKKCFSRETPAHCSEAAKLRWETTAFLTLK